MSHALPAHLVEQLLANGTATALQPRDPPSPVHHNGRWWHQPASEPLDADYVPADPETAQVYQTLQRRRRQADHALDQAESLRRIG